MTSASFVNKARKKFHELKRVWESGRYSGDRVLCPICKSTFRIFGSFGATHRKNAHCLHCGSLERHRLLWLYYQQRTSLFSNQQKSVLHFAPEKMFYDILSANKSIEYVPCDLFPEIYDFQGPVAISMVDIISIPLKPESFDVVLCNHVLEHIPDDHLAMKEIWRVLKRGGWAILQVPLDYAREKTYEDFSITTPEGRKKAFGRAGHVRWYGRDYVQRLQAAGFIVKEDDFVAGFTEEELFRFGLNSNEKVYYCTKP